MSSNILNDELRSTDNIIDPNETIEHEFIAGHCLSIESASNNECQSDNQMIDLENIKIVSETMATDLRSLELIDCQIELMDQFKLTDHIDLSSNEIHLNDDIFANSIVDLSGFSMNLKCDALPETTKCTSTKLLSDISKHPNLPTKRRNLGFDQGVEATNSLLFNQWLDSVIERINDCMDFNDCGRPEPLVFSVYHVHMFCKFNVFQNYHHFFFLGVLQSTWITFFHRFKTSFTAD